MTSKLHSAPQSGEEALGNNSDDGAPVILHPLVVLNVSDHYTRYAAMRMFSTEHAHPRRGAPPPPPSEGLSDEYGNPRVIGLLLGTQCGRIVEVCHSIELTASVRTTDGSVDVDNTFMTSRLEQYNQIFAQYIVVGWYSTGTHVSTDDLRLHQAVFSQLNEAPILLLMNPNKPRHTPAASTDDMHMSSERTDANAMTPTASSASSSKSAHGHGHVPSVLTTFQMELKVVDDKPKKVLAPVAHRYASEDSERIAVDHVMRHAIPGNGDGTSSTALHLGTLRGSIKMLQSRLQLIVKFLEATVNGDVPVDHDLLRQVAAVCARLPALDCDEFSEAYADEKVDSQVVSYLAGVTKTLCSLSESLEMFNRFNSRPSNSGPPRRRSAFLRS